MKLRQVKTKHRVIAASLLVAIAAGAISALSGCAQRGEEEKKMPTDYTFNADPAYYTEKFRPQYHLSPETGNMSDPNGMVFFEGEYHQFYQHSGQWGHAVSKDLIHWEHLPLAIARDELGDIWSGSAVADWKDTSGFFGGKPGLVAIFTHFKHGLQSQSIAYSTDKGRTWVKYEGNPVIPNPNVKDFRDPKVLWHEPSQSWVMVVSVDQKVWFYRSPDLKHWEHSGEFGLGHGSHAAVWECPDLFELPVEGTGEKKWVLTLSIGNNAATKGSRAQYFIGTFDGKTFKNDNKPAVTLWSDFGKDFYAAVSYSDIPAEDSRRIWLGWMSNWRYPFAMPTGAWKGNMSIPRVLKLRDIEGEGVRLVQEPIEELDSLRGKPVKIGKAKLTEGNNPLADVQGISYELDATFDVIDDKPFGALVRVGQDGQQTAIRYEPQTGELVLDRTKSGVSDFEANFAERMSAPVKPKDGAVKLRVYVDDTTVEVFANDGEVVLTAIVFPEPTSAGVALFSEGETKLRDAVYYPMRTVWRDEDPNSDKPLRIALSPSILRVKAGETGRLSAAVLPFAASQDIVWESTDPSVAEIAAGEDGIAAVKGLKAGQATLKAVSKDGNASHSLNVFVE